MKKNTKIKTKHGLIIIIVFVLLFGIGIYLVANTNKGSTPQTDSILDTKQKTKIFRSSSVMKFSIVVPSNYEVVERLGSVTISTNAEEIHVDRIGTNFETLDSHLDNLSKLNHLTILEKENLTINSLPAVKGIINGKKHYFIYGAPWTVYSIFTSSESLFPALDQIASSFRYTPQF